LLHKFIVWLKARLPHGFKQKLKKLLGIGSTAQEVSLFARLDIDSSKINIAIYAGGGLGDFIVYKAIIDSLLNNYNCMIYLFTLSYENAVTILGNTIGLEVHYSVMTQNNEQFDLVLDMDHFINVRDFNMSRLKNKSLKLYDDVNRIIAYNRANIPSTDNILAQRNVIIFRAKYLGLNRWTQLSCGGVFDMTSMRSGITIDECSSIIDSYSLKNNSYITISRGADVDMGGMRQTKIWPLHRYVEFVSLFKAKYTTIKIVQLALKDEPEIPGTDIVIRDASFEDVKVILSNSQAHISNEGGLVHTATQLGTRCIVPFGPTPAHYYGYPENINIVSPVCKGCMETTDDWFQRCPRGYESAECMEAITGYMILEKLANHILILNADYNL